MTKPKPKPKPKVARAEERLVVGLEEMIPADYNPRTMTARARAGLGRSLKTFGYVQDIVVNRRIVGNGWPEDEDGRLVVVSGHRRREELLADGFDAAEVTVREWDASTEKAANLTFNNPHITGEFTAEAVDLLDGLDFEVPELAELRFEDLLADWATPDLTIPEPAAPRGDSTTTCPKCGHEW